jgi:hypothetical protein
MLEFMCGLWWVTVFCVPILLLVLVIGKSKNPLEQLALGFVVFCLVCALIGMLSGGCSCNQPAPSHLDDLR